MPACRERERLEQPRWRARWKGHLRERLSHEERSHPVGVGDEAVVRSERPVQVRVETRPPISRLSVVTCSQCGPSTR